MPVAFSSRLAYLAVQTGLAGTRREVWEAIRDWEGVSGPSIEDIAQCLGMKESSVCGRVNELRKLSAIQDGPMKHNRTGNPAKTYRAIVYREETPVTPYRFDPQGQGELFPERPSYR